MKMIGKFIGGGQKESRIYALLTAVAVLTGLLMLITFEYEDVDSLTAWSLNFWDLLFKGRLDAFYEYTAQNVHGAVHENCGGNYLWLLPLCIWNLPLWAAHSASGTLLVTNFFSICWTKLFWSLLQAATAYVSAKICAMMTSDREKVIMTFLLVMASPEILLSVGYTGQDEITYICLFVISFYFFLKGNWKRCYFLMACCVTLCPIMILPVLAVLLFREKRIIRLFLYVTGTVLPQIAFEILYRKDQAYQAARKVNDFGQMMQGMLRGFVLQTNWGALSVAGILLCLLYFYCYFEKMPEEKAEYHKTVTYIVALVFVIVSFGMVNDFYRMFLYVPFLVIAIMISGQRVEVNLFLLTAITYGRVFQAVGNNYPKSLNSVYLMKHSWITALCDFAGKTKYLDSMEDSVCLWSYMINLGGMLDLLCLIVETCVMGAVVVLLVINRRGYRKQYETKIAQNGILAAYTLCMPAVMICYYFMVLH